MRFNQVFDFRWRYRSPEELSANMHGCGKVCLVNMLFSRFLNDYMRGNQFTEIVHGKSGIYLLSDVLHLFTLKQAQTNGVFELTERSFNAPAQTVEIFQLISGEGIPVQIGNKCFCGIVGYLKSDNTKGKRIESVSTPG